jgi:tetratricopeptide (TPR) repeat protein
VRLTPTIFLALALAAAARPASAETAAPKQAHPAPKQGGGKVPTPAGKGPKPIPTFPQKKNPPPKAEAKPKPHKRPSGVRGMFEDAQALYDAGKYEAALVAYGALLKKYPGHEPAVIQTAKSLYRLDRIKDAYAVFTKVNPQHLDPETSYEFGWSFYTNKAWDGALFAFQRVPKGHALFDLANYYGGICAIKLKKYDVAEDMLEKAVVLPDKLAKSRQLYIKHVQALRFMQEKSQLARDRDSEKNALANAGKRKNPPPAEKPITNTEYVHQGFKGVSKSARVKYAVEHQYIDFFGHRTQTFDAKVSTFELKHGPIIPLPIKMPKDRQAAIGLQLYLSAEDRITEGVEERLIIDQGEGDLVRQQNSDIDTTDVKSGIVSAEPWIEIPLPENLWLALGGEINFTYPEFERGERFGYRKGYLDLAARYLGVSYTTEAAYTELLDAETKATTTIVGGLFSVEGEPLQKLTVAAKVTYDQYDYLIPEQNLDGPDSITGGELSVAQALPLGITAKLIGASQLQTNYIFHGLPTYGQVAADGQVNSGKAILSATPVPWFTLSFSQLVSRTTWNVQNPEAKAAFEATVPDYVETFIAWAAVNMAF